MVGGASEMKTISLLPIPPPLRCTTRWRKKTLLHQFPLAVDELHQHKRALVDAEALARMEVVDTVGADNVLGIDQRVIGRSAEFRRPRLCARGQ